MFEIDRGLQAALRPWNISVSAQFIAEKQQLLSGRCKTKEEWRYSAAIENLGEEVCTSVESSAGKINILNMWLLVLKGLRIGQYAKTEQPRQETHAAN